MTIIRLQNRKRDKLEKKVVSQAYFKEGGNLTTSNQKGV